MFLLEQTRSAVKVLSKHVGDDSTTLFASSTRNNLKMKRTLRLLSVLLLAGVIVGCGKSGGSGQAQAPDPTTQPEAQAALFDRTVERVKGMIQNKDYKGAQTALDVFKKYKLTPEQQKIVDQLQSQVPK